MPIVVAGLKRPLKPKILQGSYASDSDTNLHDGIDCVNEAKMLRGVNQSYAIPRDAINADTRIFGIPFVRLTGGEFCTLAESSLYLLADLTSALAGTALTNNGSVTFATENVDDESYFYERLTAILSGSSQYLSLPTESSVQVGTNSFMASIGFRTTTTGAQVLFSYGSHVAGKAYFEIGIDSNGKIYCEIWDGTTTNTVKDTVASRFLDNIFRVATMLVDRTNSIMYLIVGGRLIGSIAITASNTLTIAGENLYIGASKASGGSVGSFFTGSVANFKLVNNGIDYATAVVWNLATTEAMASGTFTNPVSDSNKRLNNKYGTPNTNGAFFYTSLFLEDGVYEMQIQYEKGSANGKLDVIMDGVTVLSGLDTYNGSTTHNNAKSVSEIKVTGGRHTVKILNNGKNASSSGYAVNLQWISFIKRKGHENGGLMKAFLLGDEINQIYNNALTLTTDTSSDYNNDVTQTSGAANGDYCQGTLFIKKGYYRIDLIYPKGTAKGDVSIWIGNVQVIASLVAQNGSTVRNNVKTAYKRLQQGRTPIRMSVATDTGNNIAFTALRLERLSD